MRGRVGRVAAVTVLQGRGLVARPHVPASASCSSTCWGGGVIVSEHARAEALERFKNAVIDGRRAYVPGTPEKYPGAECSVRILDAEIVLALLEAQAEQAASGQFDGHQRTLVAGYIDGRVGQVPDAVAALLADRDSLAASLADAKAHLNLLLDAADAVISFHAPHGDLSSGATRPIMQLAEAAALVKEEWRGR